MVADVAHLALREQGCGGSFIGWPLTSVISQPQGRPPTLALASVLAGEHGDDAGRLLRFGRVDALDLGVRVRRAHEDGVGLPIELDVVGVGAAAGEEAVVLVAA